MGLMLVLSFLIANNHNPYRDVLTYINGAFHFGYHNARNVTIDIKDNLTMVVRGVGNFLTINATRNSRFTCITGYACTLGYSTTHRYMECSINSPAELIDNGTTLTFLLDNREEIKNKYLW